MSKQTRYIPNGNMKNMKTVQWNNWNSIPYSNSELATIALSGMKIVEVDTNGDGNFTLTERDGVYYLVVFNDVDREVQISIADEFEIQEEEF